MPSREVEFRLLQFVTNIVGDERVTVGLVHWDGGTLRSAWEPERVPSEAPAGGAARELIRALRDDAAERAPVGQAPVGGLAEVYPVREGHGSRLFWDTLRQGWATSGERDFLVLAEALALRPARERREASGPTRLPRSESFRDALIGLGNTLSGRLDPARFEINRRVVGLGELVSPISWMNGRWHHSFPLNLHKPDPKAVNTRVATALGTLEIAVPQSEVGVIVAQTPPSRAFEEGVGHAQEWIEERFAGRVELVHVVSGPNSDGLRKFGERIERDVRATNLPAHRH